MMSKMNKYVIVFLALLIACMGAAVAAESADSTDALVDDVEAVVSDSTHTADLQVSNSVSEDNNLVKTTKNVKCDENDPIIVTSNNGQDNFDDLFDVVSEENAAITVHQIKNMYSGKTIKINTDIARNDESYIINVPITLTSDYNNTIGLNTSNGYDSNIIEHWTSLNFTSGASGSTISNMQFHNTQIFVLDADYITFDHITVTANQPCGKGTGIFAIREGSTHITVTNNYFNINNNGGISVIALTNAEDCLIDHNVITGSGSVGNLIYLNTYFYNTNPAPEVTNRHNTISYNTLTGPTPANSTCFAIAIAGPDNTIEHNDIYYSGTGITTIWQGSFDTVTEELNNDDFITYYEGNKYYYNNLYNGASFTCGNYSVVEHNYITGKSTFSGHSNVTSNTFLNAITVNNNVRFHSNIATSQIVTVKKANSCFKDSIIGTLTINGPYNTYNCGGNTITTITQNLYKNYYKICNGNCPNCQSVNNLNSLKKSNNNLKSETENTIICQYSVVSDNDLTIFSNGTALIQLDDTNSMNVLFRGQNPYQSKLDEQSVIITDIILNVNSISFAGYNQYDMNALNLNFNNKQNINLRIVGNIQKNHGLVINDSWKSVTCENFVIVSNYDSERSNTGGPFVIWGDNITVRNITYTFTSSGATPMAILTPYTDNTGVAGGVCVRGENILIENCVFSISQEQYINITELGLQDDFDDDFHDHGIYFYKASNITLKNNSLSFISMDKDADIPASQYSPILGGNVTALTLKNNEINVRYVQGIKINTNNTLIENNTINVLSADKTIELNGNDNIIRYNNLESQSAEGDATVITVGNNNIVEQNPYVEVIEPELKVDTNEFTVGSMATIQASIYLGDEVMGDINKGKITFKVNGKTLKDANGKVIYAKVVGGVASIESFEVPQSWKEGSTIQAVYSGTTDLPKLSSEKTNITITSTEPIFTTESITANVGSTVNLIATITSAVPVNNAKIVFKINGKTVKDDNGKVIYVKVVNSQVNFEYTLPENLAAGTYNLTAVFISPDYGKLEDAKTLTISN